jgi:hypothetical protein
MNSTSFFFQALVFIGVVTYIWYSIFKRAETEGKKETKNPIYSFIANKRELPGTINTFFCVLIVFFMLIVSVDLHWAWNDALFDFAEEEREECRSVSSHQASDCEYNVNGMYFDTDGPTMFDGYSSDHPFMADGPWIWIGFFAVASLLSLGLLGRGYRQIRSLELQFNKRKAETALIPMLALDPQCVSEGRVDLPVPIEPLYPTIVEQFTSPLLLFTSVLVTLGTLAAVAYELFDGGFKDTYKISTDLFDLPIFYEYVLTALLAYYAFMVVYVCYSLFPYFDRPIFDESSSLLTSQITGVASVEKQDSEDRPVIESDEPARMDAVIQILEMEMQRARQETQRLKGELVEANKKVVVLNTELEEKSSELEDMKVVKENLESVFEEQSQSDGKTLTMTDSVLVGDALFGSTKIDQQIVNDPLAIARAAIEAYQQGKKDAEK